MNSATCRWTATVSCVDKAGRSQDVVLTRQRPAAAANFDLSGIAVAPENSVVRGLVRGGAGQTVRLSRPADGWLQEQVVAPDGAYRFTGLQAGTYTAALAGTEVTRAGIVLDGSNEAVVDLAAPGWGWQVTDGGASPGFGIVRCRVKGRTDQRVHLWAAGWEGMTQRTGSKPEYGPDTCEFTPLGAGQYQVQPEGIESVADLTVDGSRVVWVTFTEHAAQPAPEGAITGTANDGGGRTVRLLRSPASEPAAQVQARKADQEPPSRSGKRAWPWTARRLRRSLTAPEHPQTGMRWSVEDGGDGPGFSVVRCRVAGQPGRAVSLWTWGWGGITQVSGSKPEYGPDACEFAPLGPGVYFVELEEPAVAGGPPQTVRAEVNLAANRVAWVRFEGPEAAQPSAPLPPAAAAAPSEPVAPPAAAADSVISGAVSNGDGLLVLLSWPAGRAQATVTAGRYRFEGLPAGVYRVAVLAEDPAMGELAVREGLVADGVNQLTVDFDLASPAHAESQVAGRVRGGAGRTIVLEGPLDDTNAGPVEPRSAIVAPDETYAFAGLAGGTYRAVVRDYRPAGRQHPDARRDRPGWNRRRQRPRRLRPERAGPGQKPGALSAGGQRGPLERRLPGCPALRGAFPAGGRQR